MATEEETLHPYFDNIEDDPWLCARVIETQPAALAFYVEAPENWPDTLKSRVRHHFTMMKLAPLYGTHAAVELANIEFYLSELFQHRGADGVREHLEEQALSRYQAQVNSWQTATYQALAESDWLCNGGFSNV
jgi:hypothetical protein